MKKVLIAFAALIVLYALFYVLADRWGAARLAEYDAAWKARITALREDDARRRMPVLRGAPRDGNASALEKAITDRLHAHPITSNALTGIATRSPYAAPSDEERAVLEAHRADVEALAAAVQCTRADPENPYELGIEMPIPTLADIRTLANLAIAAGHERARQGDLRGAADRYLDVARFGADTGRGTLIQAMIGVATQRHALSALGGLVSDAPAGAAPPLTEIDGALTVLEPALPMPADAFRGERLFAGSVAHFLNEKGMKDLLRTTQAIGDDSTTAYFALAIPGRAVIAHAYPTLDELMERTEKAAAVDERAARVKMLSDATAVALGSWNPIVSMSVPQINVATETLRAPRAHLAAVRLAIAVEKRRAAEGKAPAALDEKDVPVDPCASPARLRYEALDGGLGYRIWSVGANGQDDAGKSDDILVERKAPAK